MIDLLVAGGGPAGLATALYAARAGLQAVVCEPRAGVIDKACGEGLMPGAVEALAGLGVEPAGYPFRGIRYLAGDRRATAPFRHGPGLGVRRTTLHAAMRAAVLRAGVPIVQTRVRTIEQDDTCVLVDGKPARHVVAADGLHSPTRRRLGLDRSTRSHRRFGLRAHVAVTPWTRYVEVHWSPRAEAYVTPVAPDLVGVALLSSAPVSFEAQLAAFPALMSRVAARPLSAVRGAGPLRQQSARRVAGRILLVGDAGGYVDALTGEGVAMAVSQARAAVDAIIAGRPEQYEVAWRRITWRYRLLTQALLLSTRPPLLRRALVPAAVALPQAFTATVNMLARPT